MRLCPGYIVRQDWQGFGVPGAKQRFEISKHMPNSSSSLGQTIPLVMMTMFVGYPKWEQPIYQYHRHRLIKPWKNSKQTFLNYSAGWPLYSDHHERLNTSLNSSYLPGKTGGRSFTSEMILCNKAIPSFHSLPFFDQMSAGTHCPPRWIQRFAVPHFLLINIRRVFLHADAAFSRAYRVNYTGNGFTHALLMQTSVCHPMPVGRKFGRRGLTWCLRNDHQRDADRRTYRQVRCTPNNPCQCWHTYYLHSGHFFVHFCRSIDDDEANIKGKYGWNPTICFHPIPPNSVTFKSPDKIRSSLLLHRPIVKALLLRTPKTTIFNTAPVLRFCFRPHRFTFPGNLPKPGLPVSVPAFCPPCWG